MTRESNLSPSTDELLSNRTGCRPSQPHCPSGPDGDTTGWGPLPVAKCFEAADMEHTPATHREKQQHLPVKGRVPHLHTLRGQPLYASLERCNRKGREQEGKPFPPRPQSASPSRKVTGDSTPGSPTALNSDGNRAGRLAPGTSASQSLQELSSSWRREGETPEDKFWDWDSGKIKNCF